MKRRTYLQRLGLLCSLGLLLSGCLLKSARVPTRHFILAPMPAAEHGPGATQPMSVEVGFVKMPGYLLRDSVVVRKSATEIKYLERALWAQRLDQSFRQTLADNLSTLLSSHQVPPSSSAAGEVRVKVSVEVKQFDVDTQGRGTLIAGWRVTAPGSDKPLKSGQAHLARAGASPQANPQVIATTLSALTAEFSRELAQGIRQSAERGP
jgi:uncharacterized lipoprotein YmbA